MSDLETVLRKFNGTNINIFGADGHFTREGYEIYCDFCSLIYELGTIIDCFNAEEVETELDKIVKLEK